LKPLRFGSPGRLKFRETRQRVASFTSPRSPIFIGVRALPTEVLPYAQPARAWLGRDWLREFDEDTQDTCEPPTVPFCDLSRRLGHDPARVGRVLGVYLKVTMADVIALEHGAAMGDWGSVKRLALRLYHGCRIVEEAKAGSIFAAILAASSDTEIRVAFGTSYSRRASELVDLLSRVSDFLADRTVLRIGERTWPQFFASQVIPARAGVSPPP